MPNKKSTINFIVPVFRNKTTIAQLVDSLDVVFRENLPDIDYSILFVNDGSDDGSDDIVEQMANAGRPVSQIKLSRNFGQVAAIIAGLQNVNGAATIIMSGDLQEPAYTIPQMIEAWKRGNDIVIGQRIARKDKWVERISSNIFYTIISWGLTNMPAGGFDFVLLDFF